MATLEEKLKILTEGAKFDVSCSSSGSDRGANNGSLGSCHIAGLCHSFTSDGRCISLIKLLMSNNCEYDCLYCYNRRSNDIPRARLEPEEICDIVMGFYKRNYIEGLFLSSAVDGSPNKTMQKIAETLIMLRTVHKFRGYIHVKAIPGAHPDIIENVSKYADRMSVNIELPSEMSLKLLAPQKKKDMILLPMKQLSHIYKETKLEPRVKKIPAGQTTQMIIGATPDTDSQIIKLSEALYRNYGLKRVYYSAYIPVGDNSKLPIVPPNLKRENRLYEADWLLRFYGFDADELLPQGYNLSQDIDPKADWALRNIGKFPIEVNTASYEMLLRVPGIGINNAYRIIEARKYNKLTFESLKKMRVVLKRAQYFITASGEYMGIGERPDVIRNYLSGANDIRLNSGKDNEQISFEELRRDIFGNF